MSIKEEEYGSDYEDYADFQNKVDSGAELPEEREDVHNYIDGYFHLDEDSGVLSHGGISVGRVIIVSGKIYTELDANNSETPRVSGPFRTRQEAIDDLWGDRDDAFQGSAILE